MNVKKAMPGKLDAIKAMMGGGGGDGGGTQDPAGDVMGPEAGGAPEQAQEAPGGGDLDGQMNDVCERLEGAADILKGVSPEDAQDAQTLDEAKAHLDHAVKLINSLAHAEGGPQEPTAQAQGEGTERDAEL